MEPHLNPSASDIVFGWDRATDERSLAAFVQRFGRQRLLSVLLPRLADDELALVIEQLSGLLRRHLSEGEYHRLFLNDSPEGGGGGRPTLRKAGFRLPPE